MVKLSVVIPVYNCEKYLEKCLNSVINQTYQDIEIICINDGSTDNSLNILKEYALKDPRIKIISTANMGLSNARNVGIKKASGEYISFVDSDDWLEPQAYQLAIEAFIQHNTDFVAYLSNIVPDNDNIDPNWLNITKNYHKLKLNGVNYIDIKTYKKTTVTVNNKIFKTSIIKNNDINFPVGILFEDNAFITKYFLHGKLGYYIDIPLYNYRQRKDSIMYRRLKHTHTTISLDHLKIFQDVYEYYLKRNAIEQYKDILNACLHSQISCAYRFCTDKKLAIREIKKLAKSLDNRLLHSKDLELINRHKIYKLDFINGLSPIEKFFSIKNVGIRKVYNLFGIKLKIKNKTLELEEKYKKLEDNIKILNSELINLKQEISTKNQEQA